MKKLLISLTVLFSIFLFTSKVFAAKVTDVQPFSKENSDFINLELNNSDIETYISNLNLDSSLDGYIFLIYPQSSIYDFKLYIFPKEVAEDGSLMIRYSNGIYIGSNLTTYGSTPFTGYYISSYSRINKANAKNIISFNNFPFSSIKNTFTNGNGIYTNADNEIINSPVWYYSNVDIYNEYTDSWLSANGGGPKFYNVTFHLNGGIANDRNCIDDGNICRIIDTQYEDYTSPIQSDGLYQYLIHQTMTKENMQFDGWYYDSKLTRKVNADDELSEDCDFYAKWAYKNVEDFLTNTTFNTYTFDTNYEYAIISLNDSENRDIYLGLNYLDYSLEVYKYLKNNNAYVNGASICLTPYYSKDNKYYYWLKNPLDNDYEVLIIPKEKFKDNNYEFLLTTNASVSYTNDLSSVVIKDDDGNDLITDLSNSYNYSQDLLINSENDILEIFKNFGNNKNNNVFQYINQVWNMFKRSPLFTYLNMLIIGSIIILIIRAAKRH